MSVAAPSTLSTASTSGLKNRIVDHTPRSFQGSISPATPGTPQERVASIGRGTHEIEPGAATGRDGKRLSRLSNFFLVSGFFPSGRAARDRGGRSGTLQALNELAESFGLGVGEMHEGERGAVAVDS